MLGRAWGCLPGAGGTGCAPPAWARVARGDQAARLTSAAAALQRMLGASDAGLPAFQEPLAGAPPPFQTSMHADRSCRARPRPACCGLCTGAERCGARQSTVWDARCKGHMTHREGRQCGRTLRSAAGSGKQPPTEQRTREAPGSPHSGSAHAASRGEEAGQGIVAAVGSLIAEMPAFDRGRQRWRWRRWRRGDRPCRGHWRLVSSVWAGPGAALRPAGRWPQRQRRPEAASQGADQPQRIWGRMYPCDESRQEQRAAKRAAPRVAAVPRHADSRHIGAATWLSPGQCVRAALAARH